MMRRRLARHLLERGERAGTEAGSPPGAPGRADDCLGFSDERLVALAREFHFGQIASHFRRLGGPLELRQVAWWGSALADIACAAAPRQRDDDLLVDAALFYLAVALFDDVVDGEPARTTALAEPLHPFRLRIKLEKPTVRGSRLHCDEPELNLIVALFDRSLGGIGRRLRSEPAWRDEILARFEAMYASELALSDDPMAAKTLPFTLIGSLALRPGATPPRVFFERLAHLLGLWDDWQDLVADGWALAPNAHLGTVSRGALTGKVCGAARGLWITLMGMRTRHEVSRRISGALETTLESARPLPLAARQKAEALLLHMFGVPGSPVTACPVRPDARAPLASARPVSSTGRPGAPGLA